MSWKKCFFAFILFVVISSYGFTQNIFTGYIRDSTTNEPLSGAMVYDSISQEGVLSNEFGLFRIKIQPNSVLLISYTGYRKVIVSTVYPESSKNIYLNPGNELKEIIIQANKDLLENKLPGIIGLSIERLKSIPSVGGERDIIKAISIMPGISNGSEGSSTLLVRGGGQDQNLFVLDGAPVYNTGHLLNFISVFNPEALKKVDFYKGGMPARYGGRLSSVVDVTFKEGNKNKTTGFLDLGLINSKFSLEGPIGKQGQTSYLIATRSTYLNLLFSLAGRSPRKVKSFELADYTGYKFYDLNLKLNHEWNQKQRIFLSYYEGSDQLRVMDSHFDTREINDNIISIFNKSATIKYFHLISNKLSFNTILNYTMNEGTNKFSQDRIDNVFKGGTPITTFQRNNRQNLLKDYSLFLQFDYALSNSHFFRFGVQSTIHSYQPNSSSLIINESQGIDSTTFHFNQSYFSPHLMANELGAYLEDEFSIGKKIGGNIGLRTSYFSQSGTIYQGLEPRAALKYSIPNFLSINMTYARNYQYSHALLSNESGLERLIWVPSGKDLKPQSSETFSLGITKRISSIDFTLEAYSKKMNNLSQFIYYYDFGDNIYQNWQNNLLKNGTGKSKGLEFLANRSEGRLSGLLSYTLSKTTRQFPDYNEGKEFPFKYDRTHNANLFLSYKLNSQWKIGALFNYSSGFKFTLPEGKIKDIPFFNSINFVGNDQYLYLKVNEGIMPAYHRLDLSASNEKILKNGRSRTWSFNVINAYNRVNPLYIFIRKGFTFSNTSHPTDPPISYPTKLKAVNLLPILPSVNYSIKF